MTKGETVESLLSPSLRVSRPVAACSRCRSAKIKCDGKLPACTACEKAGKAGSCSGANDEFAKGKERSYVAALEGACERLQKRIAEARATKDSEALAGGLMGLQAVAVKPQVVGHAQRREASDVDDLVGDFGFLSVNATSRDFHGFTGTWSWARLLLTMVTQKPVPKFDSLALPTRYYATQLIQRYLDTVYVLTPFISETELMASLSAVYQDAGRQGTPRDHWTVRMVLAIAIASMAQSKNDPAHQQALNQVSAALEVAEEVLHPGSIAGLQALLLLTQYSLIDAEHYRCWHLIGISSRVLVDLGLHQELTPDVNIPKTVLEMRRRVFYSLYCMDRHISMAYNHAFSFTDDSTAVNLHTTASFPRDTTRSSMISQQDLFLHSIQPSLLLCEIRGIQSRAYQILCESSRQVWAESPTAEGYVWSLLPIVQKWYNSIPSTLSQQHLLFFHLESLYTQIFILSPSIRTPSIPDLHKALIFDYAIEYADKMQPVIQDIGWHPFLTCADIRRMNNIGNIFLDLLWSAYDRLLAGQIRQPTPISPDPSAPQPPSYRPKTDILSNIDRALRFFNLTLEVLEYARQRWDIGNLRDRYEQESAVMMNKLRLKQSEVQGQRPEPQRQALKGVPSFQQLQSQLPASSQYPAGFQQSQPWPNLGYQPPASSANHGQQPQSYYTQPMQTSYAPPHDGQTYKYGPTSEQPYPYSSQSDPRQGSR